MAVFRKPFLLTLALGGFLPCVQPLSAASESAPLVVGETFTIDSKALGETRRINVYLPPGSKEAKAAPLPVLYMPDGGMAEDFLHVAGLVEVLVGDNSMRPFILVGIENTEEKDRGQSVNRGNYSTTTSCGSREED